MTDNRRAGSIVGRSRRGFNGFQRRRGSAQGEARFCTHAAAAVHRINQKTDEINDAIWGRKCCTMGLTGSLSEVALTAALTAAMTAAILAIAAPATAQVVTLRIESPIPATQSTSLSMQIFKDEVVRLSEGAIDVDLVPGSPRGSVKQLIDCVRLGSVFATWMSISNFSRLVPETAVVSIPFVFENHDEARRAIVDGPAGSLIAKRFEAKGFTLLTWLDGGTFNVTNAKRPLRTLDDFKGLTIRVMPNAAHMGTFGALGAHTVAMDLNDVDTALRQGDVDGAEQEYALMFTSKYFESQKYLSDTAHFLDFSVLIANRRAFTSLDPVHQTAIREAAEITSHRQRTISAETQATALGRLQDAGMQFDPLPPETRVALRRATAGVVDDVRKWVDPDVVNRIVAARRPPAPANVRR
jgi:TRAP-type transport system periplasmic protein